jgi:circadian clock protein KaiC
MTTMLADATASGLTALPKCPTGIQGLDELTQGGLPRGRPSLVCGGPGCGKTLMAMEFLVRGIREYDEPGVFVSFEERPEDLAANVRSLGFDLAALEADRKLMVDYVHVDPTEIDETGEFDLEGLFVRLGHAVDSVGARRVVLDTVESLFAGLSNHAILRAELRRLFRWIKNRGLTAIITCERGDGSLTRHGLEEYVSDCVVLLDHRVTDQLSTRRLRIVKYRGSSHGTDEHPFLIDDQGFSVLPVTSATLQYSVSDERVSSGVPALDEMLGGGEGLYRGSTVLVSGTAGTGKTSLAVHFARAACHRGERCLYVAFEEAPGQLSRNMRSIGVDLEPLERAGLLRMHAARPTVYGLETHLAQLGRLIQNFQPDAIVIDPISNLDQAGSLEGAGKTMVRLIDLLRREGITTFMTHLTSARDPLESTSIGISSVVDTWLLLRDTEISGERNRTLTILKSRGMAHSNQVREFLLGHNGIELVETYIGAEGVLTGSARLAQRARENAAAADRHEQITRTRRELERKRAALTARIAALEAEFAAEAAEVERQLEQQVTATHQLQSDQRAMAQSRHATILSPGNGAQADREAT